MGQYTPTERIMAEDLELPFITAYEPDIYKRVAETAKAFIEEQTCENKEKLINSFKELNKKSDV